MKKSVLFHFFTCTSSFDLITWFSFSNWFTLASARRAPSSQLSLTFPSLFPSLSFILSSLISFIPSNPHLFFIVKEGRAQDIVLPQSALLVVCTETTNAQVELKDLKQVESWRSVEPECGTGEFFPLLFPPQKHSHFYFSVLFSACFSIIIIIIIIIFKWNAQTARWISSMSKTQ